MGFSGPFPDDGPGPGVEEEDPGPGKPLGPARRRPGDQPLVRADRRDPERPRWSVGRLVVGLASADGHRASRLSSSAEFPALKTSAPDRQEVLAFAAEGHGTD